jgi:hypothetical protein
MMELPNLQRIDQEDVPDDGYIPRILPPSWRRVSDMRPVPGGGAAVFMQSGSGIIALFSQSNDLETGTWMHLSMSVPGSPPSWSQIMECRRLFFGDREAVMIVPRDNDEADLSKVVSTNRSPWHIWRRPW